MMSLIDRGQLEEEERTILAGRVALQRAATGDRAPAERRVGHIGLGFDFYVLISDTAANLSSSIPLHRNSIPAQRFTAGLISSSSNPRYSAAHWLAVGWPLRTSLPACHISRRARSQSAVE